MGVALFVKKELLGMYLNALLFVVKTKFGMVRLVFVIQKLSELTLHVFYAYQIQLLIKSKNNVFVIMDSFGIASYHLVLALPVHKMPYLNPMKKVTAVSVRQAFIHLKMFARLFHNVLLTLILTLSVKNVYVMYKDSSFSITVVLHVERMNNLTWLLKNVSVNLTFSLVQEAVFLVHSFQP